MQKYVKKDSRCVYTKAGPFSRTFIGREPEIAAARSDEAIGMARKENLVEGESPGPRVWRSHSRGGMARKENLVKGREPGTESMAEP